jgi:hypothetical protein
MISNAFCTHLSKISLLIDSKLEQSSLFDIASTTSVLGNIVILLLSLLNIFLKIKETYTKVIKFHRTIIMIAVAIIAFR